MVSITYIIYRTLFGLIALLSLNALYKLSNLLYLFLYRVVHYRLNIVRQNISLAFPDKSETERFEIERQFYHQLCDNFVESIKLLHISDKQIKEIVFVENPEMVKAIAKENHSIILFTAHLGNWELVPAIQMFYKEPSLSAEVYKPIRDKAFDRLLLKIRSRFKSRLIPQKHAYREILGLHRSNKSIIVGFVADHRSNSSQTSHYTEFLHQRTQFTVGAEKIGKHINAEFLYLNISKPSRGKYIFRFDKITPIADCEYPYTEAYYQLLEKNIQINPGLWLWSHRRWLY